MGRKNPSVDFMRAVYRRAGLPEDMWEEYHEYLHSPEFDGNPSNMDFDMHVAACREWKANNPSYDKHQQRGGGPKYNSIYDNPDYRG